MIAAIRKNLLAPNIKPNILSKIPKPLRILNFFNTEPAKSISNQKENSVAKKPLKFTAEEF